MVFRDSAYVRVCRTWATFGFLLGCTQAVKEGMLGFCNHRSFLEKQASGGFQAHVSVGIVLRRVVLRTFHAVGVWCALYALEAWGWLLAFPGLALRSATAPASPPVSGELLWTCFLAHGWKSMAQFGCFSKLEDPRYVVVLLVFLQKPAKQGSSVLRRTNGGPFF